MYLPDPFDINGVIVIVVHWHLNRSRDSDGSGFRMKQYSVFSKCLMFSLFLKQTITLTSFGEEMSELFSSPFSPMFLAFFNYPFGYPQNEPNKFQVSCCRTQKFKIWNFSQMHRHIPYLIRCHCKCCRSCLFVLFFFSRSKSCTCSKAPKSP